MRTSLGALVLLACSGAVMAGPIDIAVIHIGVDDTGTFGISNAIGYLNGDARFSSVTGIDVDANGVPTLGTLSTFASVLVVTDNRAGQLTGGGLGTQLGNVLDDYYLDGGCIVMGTFAGNTVIGVDGDILGYTPYAPTGSNAPAGLLNMGTADLSDKSLQGVSSFNSTFASTVTLANGGVLVASYLSGTVGIARTADGGIYLVNGFAAAQADYSNGSDFGLTFANALAKPMGNMIPLPGPALMATAGIGVLAVRRRRAHV